MPLFNISSIALEMVNNSIRLTISEGRGEAPSLRSIPKCLVTG
jgi:hypothetical protein